MNHIAEVREKFGLPGLFASLAGGPKIYGSDAEIVPTVELTHFEVLQLVKYWTEIFISDAEYLENCSSRREAEDVAYARNRIEAIGSMIGREVVEEVVDRVWAMHVTSARFWKPILKRYRMEERVKRAQEVWEKELAAAAAWRARGKSIV